MSHELGHNLGMPHDFINPISTPKTIRRDSKGNSCTDIYGVMDYGQAKIWSTCSVEQFTAYYNEIVNKTGKFCMALNGGTAPGDHNL